MDNNKENQFWMRRLQTIPINKTATISIARPIVRKLKLCHHDTLIEQVDDQGRIIITKANIPGTNRQFEDGDGVVA